MGKLLQSWWLERMSGTQWEERTEGMRQFRKLKNIITEGKK